MCTVSLGWYFQSVLWTNLFIYSNTKQALIWELFEGNFFFLKTKNKKERKKERKKEKFNFNNCTNEHVIHDCFKLNVQIQQEDIKDVNFIVFTKPTKFRLSVQIDTDYEYLSSIKVCSISDEDVFLNFVLQFFLFFLKE